MNLYLEFITYRIIQIKNEKSRASIHPLLLNKYSRVHEHWTRRSYRIFLKMILFTYDDYDQKAKVKDIIWINQEVIVLAWLSKRRNKSTKIKIIIRAACLHFHNRNIYIMLWLSHIHLWRRLATTITCSNALYHFFVLLKAATCKKIPTWNIFVHHFIPCHWQ